jgi:hypothetical protein
VKARSRPAPGNPRRAKPKGASSGWRTKPSFNRQGLSEGSNPRNRGLFGPAQRYGVGSTDRLNGRWDHSGGNRPDTFREEKAPKGESHERCRCETKPARDRRE